MECYAYFSKSPEFPIEEDLDHYLQMPLSKSGSSTKATDITPDTVGWGTD
jgi:hypothetical protein